MMQPYHRNSISKINWFIFALIVRAWSRSIMILKTNKAEKLYFIYLGCGNSLCAVFVPDLT